MRLTIDELEKITVVLLSRLRQVTSTDIEITQDFYWHISSGERYDVQKGPKELIGSVVDNIDEIRQLLKNDSDIALAHDIDALANVLLVISHELEKKTIV